MSKFSMTDSKINYNEKTGRVSLSFYSHTNKRELDLLLSLLGAYNSHGRQFELDEFEGLGLEDDRNGEYHRVRAEVSLNDKPTTVWIYEWLKGLDSYEIVEAGDWLTVSS